MKNKLSNQKYYFVDESGNPEIFGKQGKVIVGQKGCSKFFILGFLDVEDPKSLRSDLRKLHKDILNDPYFKHIPSIQPKAKKTALFFHAKDDIPEVRREVFRLLGSKRDLRFIAVIKDKMKVVQYAINRKKQYPNYRYSPNELYDSLTRRIFKNNLHIAEIYNICFAIRGKKPRTKAFGNCLEIAQTKFIKEHNAQDKSKIFLFPTKPVNEPCLQAADYFLWAIQRLYEREEIRYIEYIKHNISLIIDIDDTRNKEYGEYYDNRNIISLEKIKRS